MQSQDDICDGLQQVSIHVLFVLIWWVFARASLHFLQYFLHDDEGEHDSTNIASVWLGGLRAMGQVWFSRSSKRVFSSMRVMTHNWVDVDLDLWTCFLCSNGLLLVVECVVLNSFLFL